MQLADQRTAWDMDSAGGYTQRMPTEENAKGAQETLALVAEKRLAAAGKHKEKKIRSRLLSHFQWRLRGKELEGGK